MAKKPGQVIFKKGQLVQIYHSDLDYTFKMEHKLLPKWSQLRRVTKCLRNSYKLENLDGSKIEGTFSSQWLREFIPQEGTQLAMEQRELEERLSKENTEGEEEEGQVDKGEDEDGEETEEEEAEEEDDTADEEDDNAEEVEKEG